MAREPVTQPAPEDHEWGQDADSGDLAAPSNGLIDAAYVGNAIPLNNEHNWLFRKFHQVTRFFIQRGLPNWHASETYQAGDIVRYGSVFYVALAPTVGENPASNEFLQSRKWERWVYSPFGTDRSATDDSPIVSWRNARSFVGNQIDRLGFFAGPRTQNIHETWMGAETLTATGSADFVNTDRRWAGSVTLGGTGGGIAIGNPNATQRSRYLDISIGTGAADDALMIMKESPSIFDADVDAALEAVVWTKASVDLMRPVFGLYSAGDQWGTGSSFVGAIIYKKHASGNWFCRTGDGTTLGTEVDTGIAVPAGGFTQLRVEHVGTNKDMPVSGAANRIRFYVNGSVFERTANLPSSYGSPPYIAPIIGVKRDTGTSARGIFVMPLRFSARF